MLQKLNLSHLTDEECNMIMDVLQKDFEVRRLEKKRISEAREELAREHTRIALLRDNRSFTESCCIICLERFGLIFHRKRKCSKCNLNVCSACCPPQKEIKKGVTCGVCCKEKAFQMLSNQWFYSNPQVSDKTFGSSRVVRSLNKRPASGLSESDVETSVVVPGGGRTSSRPEDFEAIRPQQGESEGVYSEELDEVKKAEEFHFRVKFEKLLEDLHETMEEENPTGHTSLASPSSMDVLLIFQDQVTELLREFTDSLRQAFESFGCTEDGRIMAKKTVGKFMEDFVGDSLNLQTLDGVSSDQFSLTNDCSSDQSSFEDYLAHCVVSKLLENLQATADETIRPFNSNNMQDDTLKNHSLGRLATSDPTNIEAIDENMADNFCDFSRNINRRMEKHSDLLADEIDDESNNYSGKLKSRVPGADIETNINSEDVRKPEYRNSTHDECSDANNKNDETHFLYGKAGYNDVSSIVDEKYGEVGELDSAAEFQELKEFVKKTTRRHKLEAAEIDDSNLCEVVEETILKGKVNRDEDNEEFQSRFMIFDRIYNSRSMLPDLSQFDSADSVSGETDPDLLSLSLAIIPEEPEEELDQGPEEMNEDVRLIKKLIFKGKGFSPYTNLGKGNANMIWDGSLYKEVPSPESCHASRTVKRNIDQMSDFSDLDYSEDEENTFYANTSKELARIARQHKRLDHSQLSPGYHSDDSSINGRLVMQKLPLMSEENSFDRGDSSGPTEVSGKQELKLLQELIPAENADPQFVEAPESVAIQEGEPVKFSCRVAGSGHVDVFWYREGDEVEELDDSEDVEIFNNGDKHNIVIYNISKKLGGQYMCIAMNEKGKAIQYLVVTVKGNKQELKRPEFLKGLKDVEVTEGQRVKFRVKVKGYPAPRISWYKDRELLRSSKSCRTEKFGNRDYILIIEHASMDDDAEYMVIARNVAGEESMSAQVIVDPLSDLPVRTQNISSTTTSGVSDSDSDRSMSYRSIVLTSTSASTPTTSCQLQTTSLARPEITRVRNPSGVLPINRLDRTTGCTRQEDEAPSKRLLTPDVLDVLQIAEDIIQHERCSSEYSLIQTDNDGKLAVKTESLADMTNHDKNMTSSLFPTQKSGPGSFVEPLILPDTLDSFVLPDCDLKSSAQLQLSSFDCAVSTIPYHTNDSFKQKVLKERYSRDFEVHQTSEGEKYTLEYLTPQAEVICGLHNADRTEEMGETSSQSCSPRQSIDSGVYVNSKWEQPQPSKADVRQASQDVVTDSQAECQLANGVELPSVDRLKAVFSSVEDDDDLGIGSFKRVHSITARNVPKDQLEKLRVSHQDLSHSSLPDIFLDAPASSSLSSQISESLPVNDNTAPSSSNARLIQVSSPAHSKISSKSPAKDISVHRTGSRRSLDLHKDPVLIYPETDPGYLKRHHPQQQHPATPRPTPKPRTASSSSPLNQQQTLGHVSTTAGQHLAKPSPQPLQQSQLSTHRVLSPDQEAAAVKGMAQRGSISARTAFWERKIVGGGDVNVQFPEIMEGSGT